MKPMIKILGSGSKGNCYLLETESETLIIECGLTYTQINKELDLDKEIVGCLVTHEHGDHSKSINQLAKLGINIYSSFGTLMSENSKGRLFKSSPRFNAIKSGKVITVGEFQIIPFKTQHDAACPLGFIIQHKSFGTLLFATDTYYIEYNFKDWNIDHFFIECNYQDYILQENLKDETIHYVQGQRLIKSHFELDNVIECLNVSKAGNTKNIVLLHMSSDNANPEEMIDKIEKKVGLKPVIAKKGLVVNLDIWDELGL